MTSKNFDSASDMELIDAANAGNPAGFEVLYVRYRNWVVGLAYRFTRSEDLALDVMQETFLYLLKNNSTIRVSGRAGGQPVQFEVTAVPSSSAAKVAIPSVWARMKIADLAYESIYAPSAQLPERIKQVALDYNLMSAFTAFIAVDSSRRTEGSQGVSVPVAVPVPEGVRYSTTVNER